MNADTYLQHRAGHLLRTGLLFAVSVLLLAAAGWVVGGPVGLIWTGLFAVSSIVIGPVAAPAVMLRATRARPLEVHEARDLHAAVRDLAERAGLSRVPSLWLMPDARPNAFTVGRRNDAVIAVSHGLLRSLSAREVIGVIAHEMSHIRHGDVWLLSAASIAHRLTSAISTVGCFLVILSIPLILFGLTTVPLAALLFLACAPVASTLVQFALSRTREFDADLEAARLTGDPSALASALERLDDVARPWWKRALFGARPERSSMLSTHPPTSERVRRLMALFETPAVRQRVAVRG